MNKKVILGVSIIVLLLGVVGYALLSEKLTINGTATVTNWKIKFEPLEGTSTTLTPTLTGDADEVKAPKISTDTHIGDYEVTLTTPGDSVAYQFNIVNSGTINAKITSFEMPVPECSLVTATANEGEPTTSDDAENVCDNLTYTLTYENGSTVKVGDTLDAKESKKVILTLTYEDTIDEDDIPTNDVKIDNLGITIIYGQNTQTSGE